MINIFYINIIGLIVILSAFIWTLAKKKYDISIGLFFVAIAYSVIVFLLKGGIT